MFVRGITLSIAAIFAVGLMAETADADHDRRKPRRIIIEDGYYPGPPIIREIPGLRILFGDYALSAEEFDELYGTPRRAYRYDEEPEPRKPKRKAREREKQKQQQQKQKSKTAAKPAKPAEPKKTAAKTAAVSSLSCEKATSVVTGYGFSSVTPSSCSGKVYAFNATRDGKSFAIKLNSANGELTEVKKLP